MIYLTVPTVLYFRASDYEIFRDWVRNYRPQFARRSIDVSNSAGLEIYRRFVLNNTRSTSDLGMRVATGLYMKVARINHSCDPNSMRRWRGGKAEIHTAVDLAAGEQATIIFIDTELRTTEERREMLKTVRTIDSAMRGGHLVVRACVVPVLRTIYYTYISQARESRQTVKF